MDLIKRWAEECYDLVMEERGEEVVQFVTEKLQDEFEIFVEYLTNIANDPENSNHALCNWFTCRGGKLPADSDSVRDLLREDLSKPEPIIIDYLVEVVCDEVIFGDDEPWKWTGERRR